MTHTTNLTDNPETDAALEADAPAPAQAVVVDQQVCDRCGCVVALWDVHVPVCPGILHAPTDPTEAPDGA